MRTLARSSRLEAVSPKPYGLQLMAAASRFGRYKPEPSQEVRKPDVQGQTFVEQVKRTREMLRSMKPEAVSQIIEFHKGLGFFEALALAKREGKLIVPNDIHDRILTETKDEIYLRQNYPVRTGTFIIREAPDKPFGKNVVCSWDDNKVVYSISFKVPKQFRGKVNCALVVEHPDFELIDRELGDLPKGQTDLGNNRYEIRVSDEANIHQIEQFPKIEGWHLTDHGIPVGAKVGDSIDDARYLLRSYKAYLGPVRRGYGDRRGGQYVILDGGPFFGCGVGMVPLTVVSSD